MRELKFRIWDNNLKHLYTPDMEAHMWEVKKMPNGVYQEQDGIITMQYTGLRDIENKEIWEGDLILSYGRNGDNPCHVIFEDGKFQGKYTEPGSKFTFTLDSGELRLSRTKVVGNIYENPELMEATNAKY